VADTLDVWLAKCPRELTYTYTDGTQVAVTIYPDAIRDAVDHVVSMAHHGRPNVPFIAGRSTNWGNREHGLVTAVRRRHDLTDGRPAMTTSERAARKRIRDAILALDEPEHHGINVFLDGVRFRAPSGRYADVERGSGGFQYQLWHKDIQPEMTGVAKSDATILRHVYRWMNGPDFIISKGD
jgi:hypothetical protein